MGTEQSTKVFVVDDNIVARSMLSRMSGSIAGISVVGDMGTGHGAVLMLDEINPDIVLLEATVKSNLNIVDVVKQMKVLKPDVRIILCADHMGIDYVMPAIDAGASDFVLKPIKSEVLERIIKRVITL